LKKLGLSANRLERIEGVSGLRQLTQISLGRNAIERIDGLAGLPALTALALDNNRISLLENLEVLPALKTLVVSGNPLTAIRRRTLEFLISNKVDIWTNLEAAIPAATLADSLKVVE
jgi:Leucine-rich repeat (LRR) protein